MKVQNKVIIGAAVAGLMAIVSLLPRSHERVHVLARDGAHYEALQGLLAIYEAGDRKPETLTQLYKLSLRIGDHESATRFLEAYLAQRPNDGDAWLFQAELQAVMHDPDGQRHSLEQATRIAPTPERVRKLLDQYRLRGEFHEELALMRQSEVQPHLRVGDLERLGHLLAQQGEYENALPVLQRYDSRSPMELESGRLLLVDILLDLKQENEALRHAVGWINSTRQEWRAINLIRRFAAKRSTSGTRRLASVIVEMFPHTTFGLATALADMGQHVIAQGIIDRWLAKKADRTVKEFGDYVWAMRTLGADAAPIALFAKWAQQSAPPERLMNLAKGIYSGYGYNGLAPIRAYLTPKLLAEQPLFAAEIMLLEGQPHLAHPYLARANPAAMTKTERDLWISLLAAANNTDAAFRLLADLQNQRRLPGDLLPAFGMIASAVGQPHAHDLAYARLGLPGR